MGQNEDLVVDEQESQTKCEEAIKRARKMQENKTCLTCSGPGSLAPQYACVNFRSSYARDALGYTEIWFSEECECEYVYAGRGRRSSTEENENAKKKYFAKYDGNFRNRRATRRVR